MIFDGFFVVIPYTMIRRMIADIIANSGQMCSRVCGWCSLARLSGDVYIFE
jgi:hypothetical protein